MVLLKTIFSVKTFLKIILNICIIRVKLYICKYDKHFKYHFLPINYWFTVLAVNAGMLKLASKNQPTLKSTISEGVCCNSFLIYIWYQYFSDLLIYKLLAIE